MTQTVVAVTRFWIEIFGNRVRVVRQWTITRGAYVAVIDECPCGLMGAGANRWQNNVKRTNCLCRSEVCRNNPTRRNVCHGWHQSRIDAMVEELERPKVRRLSPVGVSRVAPRDMVGLHGYRWSDIYPGSG